MRWSFNEVLFAMGRSSGFQEATDSMKHFVMSWSQGIGTTKQTEDVFQRGRCDERSGQLNQEVSHRRRFATAIRSDVLEQVHRFEQVPYLDIVLDRDEEKVFKNTDAIFVPMDKKKSLPELRQIVSLSSTPSYPTFSPQSIAKVYGDMEAIVHCSRTKRWLLAEHSWHAVLLPRGVLVKGPGHESWVWSLGSLEERSVLTWPAQRHEVSPEHAYYTMDGECGIDDIGFSLCFNIREWAVQPTRWSSPLVHVISTRKPNLLRGGVVAVPVGEARSALEHAALECFYDLEMGLLNRISEKFLDLKLGNATMFDMLSAMVKVVLKLDDESELLAEILAKRCIAQASSLRDLLADDGVEGVLDEKGPKQLEDEAKSTKARRCERDHDRESFKAWRASKRPPEPAGARGPSSRAGGRSSSSSAGRLRPCQACLPARSPGMKRKHSCHPGAASSGANGIAAGGATSQARTGGMCARRAPRCGEIV